MNKKGFTLVELLATITIIGIICVIIFPSVSNLIRTNEASTAEEMGKMLIASAKKYVNDEKMEGEGCYSIKAKELIEKELLQNLNVNNLKCDAENSFVRIDFTEKNKKYSYHLSCTSKQQQKTFDSEKSTVSYCDDFTPNAKGKITASSKMYPPDLGARESDGANEYGFDKKRNTVIPKNSNLVPIRYYKNKWIKADVTNKKAGYYWYDYKNAMWANMVVVKEEKKEQYYNAKVGTEVNLEDVISMWVWIPRFSFTIPYEQTKSGRSTFPSDPVKIKFIDVEEKDEGKEGNSTCQYTKGKEDPDYCTPEAFTSVDNKPLTGFWFAKFELATDCEKDEEDGYNYNPLIIKTQVYHNTCITDANTILQKEAYIKPNKCAYVCLGYIESFNKIKDMEKTLTSSAEKDIHMIRNNEWSTVTYFTYSKYGLNNIKGTIKSTNMNRANNYYHTLIGSSFDSGKNKIDLYNYKEGLEGSTTHNIYGIYDMNGRDTYTTSYYGGITNEIYINNETQKEARILKLEEKYKKYFIDEYSNTENTTSTNPYGIKQEELNKNNRLTLTASDRYTSYTNSNSSPIVCGLDDADFDAFLSSKMEPEKYTQYHDACYKKFDCTYKIINAMRTRGETFLNSSYNNSSYIQGEKYTFFNPLIKERYWKGKCMETIDNLNLDINMFYQYIKENMRSSNVNIDQEASITSRAALYFK